MSTNERDPGAGNVVCSICGVSFAVPGFDAAQTARALAQHIAANHSREIGKAAENALGNSAGKSVEQLGEQPTGNAANSTGNSSTNGATGPVAPPVTPPFTAAGAPGSATDDGQTGSPSTVNPAASVDDHGRADEAQDSPNPEAATGSDRIPDGGPGRGPDAGRDRRQRHGDPLRRSDGPATPQRNDNDPRRDRTPPPWRAGDPTESGPTDQAPRKGPPTPSDEAKASKQASRSGDATKPRSLGDAVKRSVGQRAGRAAGKSAGQAAGKSGKASIGKRFEQGVTKGLQTAGASVGIPPIVTKVLIRVAKRGIPLLLAAAVLFATALFGGTLIENGAEDTVWDVALSEQLDIPEPYLDAYRSAARTHKLPWTLLAAIGANASYHGRIDPYKQAIPLPAPRNVDDTGRDTRRVIVLADAAIADIGTYLGPLLTTTSYRLEVVDVDSIDGGRAWLEENATSGDPVVVAVGRNETGSRQEFSDKVNRFLNTLGLHQRVLWITLDTGEQASAYNEILRERDQNRPNLRLIDWAGQADTRGFVPDADGNYTAEAERERAVLIAGALTGNVVSAGLPVSSELSGPGVLPTPSGSCPSLPVPIEGESPAQGAGPLMLLPAALAGAGYDLGEDIQNICDSVDTLAELFAETARAVADEEGTSFPRGIANLAQQAGGGDSVAAEQVHDFWAKVVDRSGVLGTTEERECAIPEQGSLDDQAFVGNAIDSYWRCALANVELVSVGDVIVDAAGNVSYRLLDGSASVARGVDEALGVSWNWSAWGDAACDETAVHAGVFPLTTAVFARYAEDPEAGRCDREQNIIAAAEAFIVGESTPAATRSGRWNASIGGWTLFGPVAGPAGPGLFDTQGPWRPLSPSTECSRILVARTLEAARDGAFLPGMTAGQTQELAYAGSTDEFDTTGIRTGGTFPTEDALLAATQGLDARLDALAAAVRADPLCAQERPYADAEWLGVLAGAVNGDALTSAEDGVDLSIPARSTGNLLVPASAGDRVLMLAGRAFSRAVAYAGVAPASSAYVQRLSNVRVALQARPPVESESGERTLSLGHRMINVAVGYYGGIFVGNTGEAIVGLGFLDETVPFFEEFNSVGQEYGIDPRLLAAVAKQESNFDPEAGCPTEGAFGMMQKEFDTVPTICGDVRRQISVAAEMLLDLYQRAGDWKGALWGYNNGARFADTWAALNGEVSAAEGFAYEWYRGQGVCAATGECRRAEIAMDYISETPGVRSAMLNWLEYQQLFPSSVFSSRQTVVNGNECPNVEPRSSIPGRTVLRDGAETIGIRELCVEAVAAAPTPEAARAIIFAFNNLGIAYSQELRSTDRAFDCSSYVSRAYEASGLVMNSGGSHFSTHSLFPHSGRTRPEWVVPIAVHAARPGDLVFPSQGHVAMWLPRGFIIHTNATGDVSKVERGYANPLQVNRVVPEVAPRRGG